VLQENAWNPNSSAVRSAYRYENLPTILVCVRVELRNDSPAELGAFRLLASQTGLFAIVGAAGISRLIR
jgi:hypothetical protein